MFDRLRGSGGVAGWIVMCLIAVGLVRWATLLDFGSPAHAEIVGEVETIAAPEPSPIVVEDATPAIAKCPDLAGKPPEPAGKPLDLGSKSPELEQTAGDTETVQWVQKLVTFSDEFRERIAALERNQWNATRETASTGLEGRVTALEALTGAILKTQGKQWESLSKTLDVVGGLVGKLEELERKACKCATQEPMPVFEAPVIEPPKPAPIANVVPVVAPVVPRAATDVFDERRPPLPGDNVLYVVFGDQCLPCDAWKASPIPGMVQRDGFRVEYVPDANSNMRGGVVPRFILCIGQKFARSSGYMEYMRFKEIERAVLEATRQ